MCAVMMDEMLTVAKLVTTAKAFRAASRDGRGNPAAAAATIETRIPESFEKFNALLDDLECDLVSKNSPTATILPSVAPSH